jgi:hypothetical protein
MPKILNRAIKICGEDRVVGSSKTVVKVLEYDVNGNIYRAQGATVPTDGDAGYAIGCIFMDTDGGINLTSYVNDGSTTSCDFNAAIGGTGDITSVVAGAGLTGGGSSGAVTLNVINTDGKITVGADTIDITANSLVNADVNSAANIAGSKIQYLNDIPLTLGTTTATAATKVTLEFDATTTGIGQFTMGSMAAPQVLVANPGATVSADTVNILHSAGAGDCTDLLGRYTKVAMSGDGDADTTLVGSAPRAYVLGGTTVAGQVYGSQPWVKHTGTGTITAMSALSANLILNDADAFTSTNSINAGHFHVSTVAGAANGVVTSGNFDGVMIEIYPNVTGLDSGLHIAQDSATVTDDVIKVTGTKFTNFLEIAAGDCAVVSNGTYSTAEGYLVIKVGASTYRVPFFTGVDA